VSADEQRHLALPQLFGAPAYARPAAPVAHTPRPFNPDDLPLLETLTEEERVALERPHAYVERPLAFQPAAGVAGPAPGLTARPFSLRALADRLRATRD
jgi:GAF domain-containing protein